MILILLMGMDEIQLAQLRQDGLEHWGIQQQQVYVQKYVEMEE